MQNSELRADILALLHQQVVPAIGCTEPIAVALATAKAAERLGTLPEKITARLSANILKNAMGVGIPGTGMVGLPIAIALGAMVGKSAYGLEVLRDCQPADVERGKAYIDEGRIDIAIENGTDEKLYIDIVVSDTQGREARATIAQEHTKFVDSQSEQDTRVVLNDGCHTTHDSDAGTGGNVGSDVGHGIGQRLNLRMVYDFATTAPLDELEWIGEAGRVNMEASALSLKGNYGHCLGKAMTRPMGRGILGDSIFSRVLAATSSACDARMAGAMIPVMSNSGSGNQGICATNPVMVFARENHNTHEELVRALILSHLTAIYIKQHLGTLSALCGCVVAATGSACGITLLMGGDYGQVSAAVKNMIANLTGMICDGAKPSCALKLTSGVSTAVLSAMLAMQGKCVTSVEGIIDDCVDRSIRNLADIGKNAMAETDRKVLDIMTHKG